MAKLNLVGRWRHLTIPALVLIVGLAATVLTAFQLHAADKARDASRLGIEANLAVSALQQRMEGHSALLRGTAGLFAGSSDVTSHEFLAYVDRLGLGSRYPGVLGIGYAAWLPNADAEARLAEAARARGETGFRIWPADGRGPRSAIVYLSPPTGQNESAIGFDMYSEATRREAMDRAARTGDLAMSGRVTLVQDGRASDQPGVLMFIPVTAADGAGGRRLLGFVYSPLRAGDLLETVFPRKPDRLVDVAVYDGAPEPGRLLFQTAPPRVTPGALSTLRVMQVAGRPWSVVTRTRPAFAAGGNRWLTIWTSGLGLAATLALSFGVLVQARAGMQAEAARGELRQTNASLEDRVAQRTVELARANADLRAEMARREDAEGQVRQMQKMEAIGQLTGGIAHDFNNTLAIVVGSLDMARRRLTGAEDPRVARYLDNAVEGANRAAALTARLLAFARRQKLSPEPIDANALVQGMTDLLRRSLGERVAVTTVLEDGLWPIHADAVGLENALVNLAVNARDAMPDGGRLLLTTSNVAAPAADEGGGPASGEFVRIRIADDGTGMPREVAERAFEPFFTTKDVGKGTGLGLSQVYGFVSQSGGRVVLHSAPGAGTTVSIYLPRWVGVLADKAKNKPDAALPRGRNEAVLVVEDEDEVRRISVESLRDLGYDVEEAANAGEALATLRRRPAVDLLFTDIVMPGMDGLELARTARSAKPELRVLYTTGYARDAAGAEAVQSSLLSKPFTIEQLARRVRQALDEGRAA